MLSKQLMFASPHVCLSRVGRCRGGDGRRGPGIPPRCAFLAGAADPDKYRCLLNLNVVDNGNKRVMREVPL